VNLTDSHPLLHYYIQELSFLRRAGVGFAQQYPKVAARLELSEGECPDPHVERLIEAFALLSGRLQYNIDSEFPLFTTALLENLYPHYLAPIPSMSIAQFDVDPDQGPLGDGHVIPAHTPLFTQSSQDVTCRFRTCYPVTLWPLTVSFAGFEPTSRYDFLDTVPEVATVLRLRLHRLGGAALHDLRLNSLRLHLHGIWIEISQLYEMLFCNVLWVGVLGQDQRNPLMLPSEAIQAVGFEEEVLPSQPHAHPAYRLLQEYFAFPEKFLFFDLQGLNTWRARAEDTYVDILFMLDRRPADSLLVDASSFRLGCTPIINLFKQLTEPLRLTQQQTEYRLMPDMRREYATEIHSILKVSASTDDADEVTVLQPFFSFRHHLHGADQRYFWAARRQPSERADLPGTEILMSFLDLNFSPGQPAQDTLYAHTLCTNRHLAAQVPANAVLQIEAVAPLLCIRCLNKPTPQRDPPLQGSSVWRIVSHLSLNHLSLTDGPESLTALRELLRLYQFAAPHKPIDRQVMGIRKLHAEATVRRLGLDAWRGFVRGFEIQLEFDNSFYVGSSAFLLGTVLNHFFPLYVSANSFTQLVIKSSQREGVWKRWPPRSGQKLLL